jgi:hypothetical protein
MKNTLQGFIMEVVLEGILLKEHHPYEINWNARTIHSLRETLN